MQCKNFYHFSIVLCVLFVDGIDALAFTKKVSDKNKASTVKNINRIKSSLLSSSAKPWNYQQQTIVAGKVSDNSGDPLQGVSVMLKGTTQGTVSDIKGNYTLNIADGRGILVFSYLGFLTTEVPVNNRSVVNITLNPDSKTMNQIVVVGYGKQKRENIIGSVGQITSDQVENRSVAQLGQALTGQIPGVTVIQRTGAPGSGGGTISIRGVGSFGAGIEPLIVVDGIPGGAFNQIDPNDVESISVLKDASSAAIYGARAANGVILVTTKSGKAGKTRMSYHAYAGFQRATAYPDFANAAEFAEMFNEATATQTYTAAEIQKFSDGSDPDNYANTDFMRLMFSKKGLQTGHNISLNGGTPGNLFNLSLGFLFQDGLVIKNNYSKYNLRLNLKNELNSKFDLTTNISAITNTVNEPAAPAPANDNSLNEIISTAVKYHPTFPVKYSNGYYSRGAIQAGTPISYIESESFRKDGNTNLLGNMRLDYKVLDGLKLSLIAGGNLSLGNEKWFQASQIIDSALTLGPTRLTRNINMTKYYTLQSLAEYNRRIGKHQVGALLGYSFESSYYEESSLFRDNLPGNVLTEINVGSPENQQAQGTANEWAIQSLFSRVNYAFSNKYLVEGVLRYDGSSRFPTTEKFALFPSAALGWRLSQENFIKDNFSWINELKLKASYGILGNQEINNYPYQNTLDIGNNYNYNFGGTVSPGAARTTLIDSTLHWESTRTSDVGIELGIFKGKLTVSATYFDRSTYDILYSPGASVSNTLGFRLSQQNTGKLKNSGWEFIINHRNKTGEFNYDASLNFSVIKNEVLDLGVGNIQQPNGMIGNGNNLFVGQPLQMYYGYIADGLFVNEEDIKNWADQSKISPRSRPGDIRYKDISGPKGVPDSVVDANYDRVVLGSQIPKYTFGLNLNTGYKQFELAVLLQGVAGVKGLLNSYAGYAFSNNANIQQWQIDERWTESNHRRDAGYPRLSLQSNSGGENFLSSSFWTLNGSYLRIKNLQLAYRLPDALSKRLGFSSARVYASGENLYTFSDYRPGWDAEINTGGGYYPILSNYTFGINVQF